MYGGYAHAHQITWEAWACLRGFGKALKSLRCALLPPPPSASPPPPPPAPPPPAVPPTPNSNSELRLIRSPNHKVSKIRPNLILFPTSVPPKTPHLLPQRHVPRTAPLILGRLELDSNLILILRGAILETLPWVRNIYCLRFSEKVPRKC